MLKLFQVLFLYSNLFLIFQDKVGKVSFAYMIFIYLLLLETSAFIFIFSPEPAFCT